MKKYTTSFLAGCKYALCAAGIAAGLMACSDDSPANILQPQLPAMGGSAVRSITHLGSMTSCYDWTFTYSGGRLVTGSGTVRDASSDIDGSYAYTSNLTYGNNKVNITHSKGETITAVLNTQGYIEQLKVNRNTYEFSYIDGRLSGWSRTIFENSFGQAATYRSSATLNYQNGNFSSIVYSESGKTVATLTFTPSAIVNFNGLLPEGIGKELGMLGFEHLYYAGLLGRPTTNLVQSITSTSETNADMNFTLNFDYAVSGNNVTLCNFHTPQGGVASASYEY